MGSSHHDARKRGWLVAKLPEAWPPLKYWRVAWWLASPHAAAGGVTPQPAAPLQKEILPEVIGLHRTGACLAARKRGWIVAKLPEAWLPLQYRRGVWWLASPLAAACEVTPRLAAPLQKETLPEVTGLRRTGARLAARKCGWLVEKFPGAWPPTTV